MLKSSCRISNSVFKRPAKEVRANCYCTFGETLRAHFSFIPQSNAVSQSKARFYHNANFKAKRGAFSQPC